MFKAEAAMRRMGEGSVTYRLKSSPEHTTVTFTGSHITVSELRKSIVQRTPKRTYNKNDEFYRENEYELILANAESQEVYNYEHTLIPSGAFLVVSKVPISRPISSDRINSFGLDIGGQMHTLTMTMSDYPMDDPYGYYCLEDWVNDKIGCPLFYQYDPYISSSPQNNNNSKNCVNANRNVENPKQKATA